MVAVCLTKHSGGGVSFATYIRSSAAVCLEALGLVVPRSDGAFGRALRALTVSPRCSWPSSCEESLKLEKRLSFWWRDTQCKLLAEGNVVLEPHPKTGGQGVAPPRRPCVSNSTAYPAVAVARLYRRTHYNMRGEFARPPLVREGYDFQS